MGSAVGIEGAETCGEKSRLGSADGDGEEGAGDMTGGNENELTTLHSFCCLLLNNLSNSSRFRSNRGVPVSAISLF